MSQSDMLELKVAAATNDVTPVTDSAFKLADTLGFYEKHGVKVEIIALQGTPQAVAALTSGAVDLADISIDSVLRLRAENDVGLRGVVSSTLGPPFLIAGKCEIESVADLAGRPYAINDNGSLDHSLMQHVLTSNGVDPESPEFIAIGAPAARAQALAAGSYAGFWVTRLDQAARFSVALAATPSVNVTPSMTKGNWLAPFRRRHVFAAA